MSKLGDDCFYFYTSKCTKGDSCRYRHCEAARKSTVTCNFWRQNKCRIPECPYRHSETIKPIVQQNKAEMPCYFETVASGCIKPNCPFKHTRGTIAGTSKSSSNIITLVDATQECVPSQPQAGTLAEPIPDLSQPPPSLSQHDVGPIIDPIVVNPAEDSDVDSPYGSPVKSAQQKPAALSSNVIDVTSRKDLTFTESEVTESQLEENKSPETQPVKSGKTSPPDEQVVSLSQSIQTKAAPTLKKESSSVNVSQVKKASSSAKSSQNTKKTSPKTAVTGKKQLQAVKSKQSLNKPQVSPSSRSLSKDRPSSSKKHGLISKSSRMRQEADRKKQATPVVPVEPKVISLKKETKQKKVESSAEEEEEGEKSGDESLGIKSLEQTLRERALRSMGIIELKSGRIVRTKDLPKKEKRRSSEDRRPSSTPRRRSADKQQSLKKKKNTGELFTEGKEERMRRLRIEREREKKRKEIMAAKMKARAKAAEAAKKVVKQEEEEESVEESEDEESDAEEEKSEEEVSGEESEQEENSSVVEDGENPEENEEDLGEEVDIELGEAEPESEEEEEMPVKVMFDTRKAVRKSDPVENFTVKKSVDLAKPKVVEEITIKKTIVVPTKEEKEKPKRKRRVILEPDDEPAPVTTFSVQSNVRKVPDEKKAKIAEKQTAPEIKPSVKPVLTSAPKARSLNVWNRRAWDSKSKESLDSRPNLGGIRSRLGTAGPSSDVGSEASQSEIKSGENGPAIRRRLGWRKTPAMAAEEDQESDSPVKKAVSLAAIRARVGQKQPADENLGGNDDDIMPSENTLNDQEKKPALPVAKKSRRPMQIYVPPAKKRVSTEEETPSSSIKRRLISKEEIKQERKDKGKTKEAKTFAQLMAEKRELQRKLEEERSLSVSPVDESQVQKKYTPIKFDIDKRDLAGDVTDLKVLKKKPGMFSANVSSSISDTSLESRSSASQHSHVTSSFSAEAIIPNSQKSLPSAHEVIHKSQEDFSDILQSNEDVTGFENPDTDSHNPADESLNMTLDNPPDSLYREPEPSVREQEITSTQNESQISETYNMSAIQPNSIANPAEGNTQDNEETISPAKRSHHSDSWLDIDIGDLDEDVNEDETNDDDLLKEIDELLA